MAVKTQIDKLDDVPAPLREHYTKVGDKFQLAIEGEHPKVTEFRDTNIALKKQVDELLPLKTKFEGVDPDEYRTLKAKAAAGDSPDVIALRAELATTKAAQTKAQAIADASVLKSTITDKFIRAGGRGNALEFIITKATPLFDVVDGALVGKTFDPNKPGEKLTPEGFIGQQIREADFAFLPSSGGGANPVRGGGGGRTNANELVDPTPQQLGEHSAAIKAGRMVVRYTNS